MANQKIPPELLIYMTSEILAADFGFTATNPVWGNSDILFGKRTAKKEHESTFIPYCYDQHRNKQEDIIDVEFTDVTDEPAGLLGDGDE